MVIEPGRALLWADTMTFSSGGPCRHVAKLAINPTAAIAGAGTGWNQLVAGGRRAIHEALDLDDLLIDLPAHLRRKAALVADQRGDPQTFRQNIFMLAGWSKRFRRIVGYAFEAESYFAPEMVRTYASPAVGDLAAMGAQSLDDLRGTVVEQIASLERGHGCTVKGKIVAATITPYEVAARVLVDLGGAFSPTSGARAAALAEGRE